MSNIALTAGINKYQTPGNDLQGCCNDVENMRSLLINGCGLSVMNVKTLINESATKERIIRELTHMVRNAQPGDHLVWYHSSHGAQVPALMGDNTEPDGMTEILCPYDFDWVPEHYITDDEVHDICALLNPGATLDILLDSCHSGDMLREVGDGTPKFIPYPFPPGVSLIAPNFVEWGKPLLIKPFSIDRGETEFHNVALWSGCRSDQTSADAFINNQHQGAFTWAFINAVSDSMNRRQIIFRIDEKLKDSGYDQEPQLETSEAMKERRVFE